MQSVKLRTVTLTGTWPEPKGKSSNTLFFNKKKKKGRREGKWGTDRKNTTPERSYLRHNLCSSRVITMSQVEPKKACLWSSRQWGRKSLTASAHWREREGEPHCLCPLTGERGRVTLPLSRRGREGESHCLCPLMGEQGRVHYLCPLSGERGRITLLLPTVGRESKTWSVVSSALQPQGLFSPWNSPGQNTGVGCHSLLQGIFPTQGLNPGLPHCRQILYQLSHQGSRFSKSEVLT